MLCEVSNKIYVQDASKEVQEWCSQNLIIDNPDYFKKQQMGKWTGNTPREIYLYERNGSTYQIPFGCLQTLYHILHEKCEFIPKFAPIRGFNYQSDISLYDYQKEAVMAGISKKNGILVMPCGSGKTQCGLEIIARIGGRALWLTHTQDLLNQSKTRAQTVFKCDKSAYGTITGGRVNVSEGITFATVQTMARIDLQQFKDAWDIVIVDECQHCAGTPTKVTQFYKVISNLNARYKIGLTATPERADGLERSMFALLGGIIHTVDKSAVAHTTCPVEVEVITTGYIPDCDVILAGDGTINYSALVDDLTHNEERFDVVLSAIAEATARGGTMVLANRVEYLQKLCKTFNDGQFGKGLCLSTMGTSKKAKEERKQALKALNDGELDCIFATYQLAKEGLDVPQLRYVIFATPEKDKTTIIQSAGRIARKADGKIIGRVIDFDDDFGMFKGWLKTRKSYYKKLDYHILT